MEDMAVVTSFFPVGPTYFGTEHTSAPDHILIPADAVAATLSCRTLRKAMEELQVIPDWRPRDHALVLWQARYQFQAPPTAPAAARWDRDYLS
eukprot:9495519-Pyramimonas_sp.AAC.1